MPRPLLTLQDITVRLKQSLLFENTSWQLTKGQHWLISGPNGAGKTTFVKAIARLVPLKYGEIKGLLSSNIQYIAFDSEQQFLQKEEIQIEFASYVGRNKKGKTVRSYFGRKSDKSIIDKFGLAYLLNQEIATLSSGELRKVFLTKAVSKKPKLLILDEPFNGLDSQAKKELNVLLLSLSKITQIILITHDDSDIPTFITHEMVIEDGKILKSAFLRKTESRSVKKRLSVTRSKISRNEGNEKGKPLIHMRNVSVKFGSRNILSNISWIVYAGAHCAVVGHNGAGKSTLVKLITGESLQVHSNDIELFGKKRDMLPLWTLKKYIGYVSSELQLHYSKGISAFDVIVSGFYDSIGLYQLPSNLEIQKVKALIKQLGLDFSDKNFIELSQGQKRLILIARAFVKSPRLLILDEPCQSLDKQNKTKVLDIIEKIGSSNQTTIILITHLEDEIVPSIINRLELKNGKIVVQ